MPKSADVTMMRGVFDFWLVDFERHDEDEPDCWYCEANAYDTDACYHCDGDGCRECAHHGYTGYSW